MASLIKYDRRPFGNQTLDFVRLTKFYCEFDYVPLPNPIERLVLDWVRLPNGLIRYAGEKGHSYDIPVRNARCEKGKILSFKVQAAPNPTENPSQYVLASFQLISQAIRPL